ncbi:MAG: AraC family ligand binding domain-containing protein, partial [Candidatus Marinimicrobia bacterium]|nr:AraC family ligand binding domain-containing protein [Candidatus Neomarinimicrobiota bacterium]
MHTMIMNYFEGIEWVTYNHMAACRARIAKVFPDYYVLDYNHRGAAILQIDAGPALPLNGPVAWFTYPGPHFRFGPASRTGWDHRHIGFRGPRVQSWLAAGLLPLAAAPPALTIQQPEAFAARMDELLDYLAAPIYGPARA